MQNLNPVLEKKVVLIAQDFLTEINTGRSRNLVTLDASLDRDLGIGSLERAELFHRVEKNCGCHFADSMIAQAKTLRDIVIAAQVATSAAPVKLDQSQKEVAVSEVDVEKAETLIDVLNLYAEADPERPHIYLLDEQGNEQTISYGDLLQKSTNVAKGLVNLGFKPSETAAIMLPTSEEFFISFFGILLAGGIPVPIYPPFRADQIASYAQHEAKILSNAEVRILITFEAAETLSKVLQPFIPSLKSVVTVSALIKTKDIELPKLSFAAEDSALIQYTSGSTSDPKGVLLSHKNLLSNLNAVGKTVKITPYDRVISWLPLYHDMGLIGTWLGSLYFGIPVTIMSPLFFLNRPERWLWAIHYYRGTISAGPNFAYELCARKISKEALEGLDLSSWRLALNGAEAVYGKTIERFTKKFVPYGFKPETMFPVYGLAESTVALAFPPLGRPPVIEKINRDLFSTEQRAVVAGPEETNYLEFVCCGKAITGHDIRIVNDAGEILPERHIGNLQFRGPSSMQGYYHNLIKTQEVYHNGWWDSGDLAYIAQDEVFITGRRKDVIIKTGRNLHAAELEDITNQVEHIRRGCVVAFGVKDNHSGSEQLIIVAETKEKDPSVKNKITAEIRERILMITGVSPDQVLLVPPKAIPKTSSGKLRRAASKELFLSDKLGRKILPVAMQFTKLFFRSIGQILKKAGNNLVRFFYTLYAGVMALVFGLPLWLSLFVLPQKTFFSSTRFWANAWLKSVGIRLNVENLRHLEAADPLIFVANHASYLDVLALIATIPKPITFVGKKELSNVPILKTFIKKLNFLSVDRMDFSQSIADTKIMEDALAQGHSIAIFPEGTFTYATGLRPFKLGAFKIAVETGCAICPVAITGTRNILRDGSWLLRPGKIEVILSEPMFASDKDWSEIIRLRTRARAEIAKYCGEQMLS